MPPPQPTSRDGLPFGSYRQAGTTGADAPSAAPPGDPPEMALPRHGSFWLADEGEATRLARRTGKGLLVDFYADWCDPCVQLDHDTFRDPMVRATLKEGYVRLRIDVTEFTRSNREQLDRYEVDQLPAVFVFGPDGELRARIDERVSPDQLIAALK